MIWRWILLFCLTGCLSPLTVCGQIDPVNRELIQAGYDQPLEGHPPPLSGYGFYYRNQPGFLQTNLTLRLAVAPVYLDSELGISGVLGEHTDLGIRMAGGGFADSYEEIRQGIFRPQESFWGHDGEGGVSLYHLFNPGQMIPFNGVLRGTAHYSVYDTTDDTAADFRLPGDHTTFSVRAGLRWGGREPLLFAPLAMELSAWYEGQFRSESGAYGSAGEPRKLEPESHLFWGEALLGYTLPKLKHSIYLSLTAGTSVEADRFSAYPGRFAAAGLGVSALAARLLFSGTERQTIRAVERDLPSAPGPAAAMEPRGHRLERRGELSAGPRAARGLE